MVDEVRVARFEGVAVLEEDWIQLRADVAIYGHAYLEPAGIRVHGPEGIEFVYRRFDPSIDDEVYAHCEELWRRVKVLSGEPRSNGKTALVNELRTMLDLAAAFPGSKFVETAKPTYTPPYISRQREQPPPEKPASVPFNEFPEGF